MPELPEVETVRSGLEPVLTGRSFVRVEQRRPDLRFPLPERFAERLTGRRVLRLGRRAKYILVHLDRDEVLAVHLGMTGRLIVSNGGGERDLTLGQYVYEHGKDAKHDHLVFTMSGGAVVTYNDARRFGYMTLIPERDLAQDAFFAGLGVEPLSDDLNGAYLARRALGRKVDLKAFLMDQRIVAGLGNIYVCEALFRAGLDPWKPASRLATRTGKADAGGGAAGGRDQGGAHRCDPRRRLHAARLQARRRHQRPVPERVRRLRPRRRALREARLPGHRAPQDAGRAVDVLLPGVPALMSDAAHGTARTRRVVCLMNE